MNSKYTVIFACYAGSHLYGTDTPDSDIDIRGICMVPLENLLGLNRFEQYQPDKDEARTYSRAMKWKESDDVCIYGLNKFFKLLLDANPNIVELLFAKPIHKSKIWPSVTLNRNLFLSTKIVHTFSGYAYSQLKRIRGHYEWLHNPPSKPDPHEHGMVYTALGGQDWTSRNLKNQYDTKLEKYQQYTHWRKNRNPKRAKLEEKYGYDTKHAMNLVRLIMEGEELLRTGGIVFPLYYRETLRSVLHGAYTYEEIVRIGERGHEHLKELGDKSTLPKKPHYKRVDELLIRINSDHIC